MFCQTDDGNTKLSSFQPGCLSWHQIHHRENFTSVLYNREMDEYLPTVRMILELYNTRKKFMRFVNKDISSMCRRVYDGTNFVVDDKERLCLRSAKTW